jgi:DNA-nicking Smr family endonuclease
MSKPDDGKPMTELFRQAIGDVRPLKQDKVAPPKQSRKPVPQQSLRDQRAVVESLLSDEFDPELETGEELLFVRPGLPHSVLRKFRRGHFLVEAELDLHGRIVPEARTLVNDFLRQAQNSGRRCVRIIHGKGLSSAGQIPVLKGKVNVWLRRKQEVLAFCSARPADGGTGAVYVLLKRN